MYDKLCEVLYDEMMSDFRTLPAGIWQQTYVVQKSRFVAFVTRVDDVAAAQAFLQKVALPDATHHCYAYVTADGQKSNDHGEPAGTAGLPILQAIHQQGLSHVAVAVDRYFGGIKLGTGGLARAYSQAARQALTMAQPVQVRDCAVLTFPTNYEQQIAITSLVAAFGKEIARQYQDIVVWQVAIPVATQREFVARLTEILRGTPPITVVNPHAWVEFPILN